MNAVRQCPRTIRRSDALAVKYPDPGRRWGWFWVFPAAKLSVDPRFRIERRHHLYEERLQRHQAGKRGGSNFQTGVSSYFEALICHASFAGWHRHPHGAGIVGSLGCQHDDDLYPCPQGGCRWYRQPAGRAWQPGSVRRRSVGVAADFWAFDSMRPLPRPFSCRPAARVPRC